MTVTHNRNSITYAGSGVAVLAYDFKIFSASDLVVTLYGTDGVGSVLQLDNDYTVAGVGVDAGGTITLQVAPVAGEYLEIKRSLEIVQLTEYTEGDNFPAKAHENALDRLTMIVQQQDEVLQRIPVTGAPVPGELFLEEFAPCNGQDDDSVGWQQAEDQLFYQTGVLRVRSPIVKLDNPVRMRPHVSRVGLGPNSCFIDSRAAQYSFYSDEQLRDLSFSGFNLSHKYNANVGVTAIDVQFGASRCLFGGPGLQGLWITPYGGHTAHGLVVHGANGGVGVNNFYNNVFHLRVHAETADVQIVNGFALKLGEQASIENAAANSNIVLGNYNYFDYGVFVNGQGNLLMPTIDKSYQAALWIYGDGRCYGNHVLPPAYFDDANVGDKIRLECIDPAVPRVLASISTVPGIAWHTQVTVVATARPALFRFNGIIYASALPPGYAPSNGTQIYVVDPVEAGGAGSKYVAFGWVYTSGGTKQLRALTGN